MAKWTEAQQLAIDVRRANLLVSAAAGSGKTAVLVERIVGLILKDRVSVDQFLIVTFTNAAAGEMRERILSALIGRLEALEPERKRQDPQEQAEMKAEAQFIRHQINKVGKAYIMTLHAFCNDVVRKNFYKVGLDPAFKIGESTELDLLKKEALDEILEEAYEMPDDAFIFLTEAYGGNRSDAKLEKLILKMHQFIQSQPSPKKWLEESADMLLLTEDAFDSSKWTEALMSYAQIEFEGVLDLANNALALCELPDGPEPYRKAIESDLDGLERVAEAFEQGYEKTGLALQGVAFERLATIKKTNLGNMSEPLLEEVKKLRDKVKKKVAEFKNDYFVKSVSDIVFEIQALHDKIVRLNALVLAFDARYKEKKTDKNLADFNDLEHLALEILEDQAIQSLYRERFHYIFLDEYQDSNSVQETLIQSICRKDNVFLVGDIKQSIYKFRLAEPSLFLKKLKTFDKTVGTQNQRIDLSMNFRTRGEVLAWVNGFFDAVMSEKMGEVTYDADQYLYNGMGFPRMDAPAVELHLIDSSDKSELDEELQFMKAAELEAQFVAGQIKVLMGSDLYHPKRKEWGKVSYKDIAVLMRSPKSNAGIYQDVFSAWEIPLQMDMGASFFETLEINMFLSLMRLVDNRRRDLDWLTVLRSPIIGLTVEAMAEIRCLSPDKTYFEAVNAYATSQETVTAKRLKQFLEQLENWERLSRHKPLDEWVWMLLNETGFYIYAGAMPGGAARQANLKQLADRAAMLSGTVFSGLFQFIRMAEKMEASSSELEAAKVSSENEDTVKLMSIHKSKGLEFPIVFLTTLGKQFNIRDTSEDVMLHKDLGIAPKYVDWEGRHYKRSFPQLAMKKQMMNEILSEEMRILYVALTRPVDRIYLVGSTSKWEADFKKWQLGVKPFQIHQAKCYLDWIAQYALDAEDYCGPEDVLEFKEAHIQKTFKQASTEGESLVSQIVVKRHTAQDVLSKKEAIEMSSETLEMTILEAASPTHSALPEKALYQAMQAGFEAATDETDSQLPSKISVSVLKQMRKGKTAADMTFQTGLVVPAFAAVQPQGMDYAARGTAFHTLMEHLDYQLTPDRVEVEHFIAACVERKIITPLLAAQVPPEWLMAFLKAPEFQSLKQSKNIHREWPFIYKALVEDETVLVQGIVDLFYEGEGQWILIDYKTDFTLKGQWDERARTRHVEQLKLYAEALEAIQGRAVDRVYLYLADSGSVLDLTSDCMGTRD